MASHLREHDQGRSPGSSFEPAWQATAHTIWPATVILVTGMSGTGKSTALLVLEARGYRVVDSGHMPFSGKRHIGIGVLGTAHDLGLHVPIDVALVDTRYPGSRSASDPLTTVYSPARQIGVTAVDRLLDLINGGEAGSTRLPVELVVRETT